MYNACCGCIKSECPSFAQCDQESRIMPHDRHCTHADSYMMFFCGPIEAPFLLLNPQRRTHMHKNEAKHASGQKVKPPSD